MVSLVQISRSGLALLASFVLAPPTVGCFGRECEDVDDLDLPGDRVTISLRNDTTGPVFVDAGTVCAWAPFSLTINDKARVWNRSPCAYRCTDVIDGACDCDRECDTPQLVRIEAGASYDIDWDLAIYDDRDLSLDCPAEGCPTKCLRRKPAGDGSYAIAVKAGTTCDGDDTACACATGATSCVLSLGLAGSANVTGSASAIVPDDAGDTVIVSLH